MVEKRGQAAMEYIILIGVLFIFLIPIVYYSFTESSTSIKASQLDNAVKRMAKAADAVYGLGPGAQDIVVITLPFGVEEAVIGNHSINLRTSTFGGINDVNAVTIGEVNGSIPIQPGTYRILIKHLSEGYVNLSLKP